MTILFSYLAQQDLESIFDYTTETWSLDQANKYIDSIQHMLGDLSAGLEKGRPALLEDWSIYQKLVGSHRVLYRQTPNCLEVIRILHQSSDLPRHPMN